ncbi:NYN domain-containing protein [Halosimplex aquaticum]|uniref:NYN domain-containing protein n=1 Tax=Halosimplex aquaticum TaxID=3026162 RepID=A0ABD5Y8M4_9EURY|nr:NYN domain-containing protein [Halosimplex aquaticum]
MRLLGRLFGGDGGDGAADGPGPGKSGSTRADSRGHDQPRVGLYVDGPNVLRDEFDVDLDDVRAAAERYGQLSFGRLYLNENAPAGLIQAAEARGFEVVTTSGDVDVKLGVDATAAAVEEAIDVLAVTSRDTDFKPVLEAAAERGLATIAIAPGEHGRSDALRNTAHEDITLD